jgi:hypothetical protein
MPWKALDARSQKGIRVTFKDGTVDDFINSGGIFFSAQIWQSEYTDDKTDGNMTVGDWDSDGKWQVKASFPTGSYSFVKVIFK